MTTEIPLLDTHAYIGRFQTQDVGAATPDTLLADMDDLGIERALVTHTMSWLHSPALGNQAVLTELAGHPRLRPCWTVLPDTCGELPAAKEFVAHALSDGVAVLRAYPAEHGYPMDGPAFVPMLSAAAEARLPLLVDCTQTSWPAIAAVAQAHPELPIIVSLVGYRTLRSSTDLLARYPNTHLDLVNFSSHCGLEWLVQQFGASRLLFGTGAPMRDAAEAVTRLLWSALDDHDVRAIGHDNAQRLLERDAA